MEEKKEQKKGEMTWSRSNGSLFEDFAISLEEYTKTGKVPAEGDQDIQYALELQDERLQKKGLAMEYKFVPRGHFPKGTGTNKNWSDEHYTSTLQWRSCKMERKFFRGTKKTYRNCKHINFFQTVTDVNTPQLIWNDVYNCPDCGAAVTIDELQKGCPYCGACFKISDIFPKVSNYYFLEDPGLTKEEAIISFLKWMLITAVVEFFAMAFYGYYFPTDYQGNLIMSLLFAFIIAVFVAPMSGGYVFLLVLMGKTIVGAFRSLVFLPSLGSGPRFVWQMKQYSPEFSYEYFSNKVISLLKMIIFTDDPSDLPVYTGGPLGGMFENVVDVFYAGSIGFKKLRVEGDFCFVTVDIFLDNLYDNGKRLFERRGKYRIEVKKNISRPVDMHFSIRHLKCRGCGMSFDAAKEKHCPGCGTVYDLENEDWVVTRMEKKIY